MNEKKRFMFEATQRFRGTGVQDAVDRRLLAREKQLMKKIALLSLLALAGLSLVSELRNHNRPVLMFAPDIPPPSCSPNCPSQ